MVPPSSRLKKLNNLSYSFCVHPFSALFSSKVADSHFLFEFPVVYLTILPSSFRLLIYLLLSGSDDLRRHLPKFLRSVLIPVRIDAVDDLYFPAAMLFLRFIFRFRFFQIRIATDSK